MAMFLWACKMYRSVGNDDEVTFELFRRTAEAGIARSYRYLAVFCMRKGSNNEAGEYLQKGADLKDVWCSHKLVSRVQSDPNQPEPAKIKLEKTLGKLMELSRYPLIKYSISRLLAKIGNEATGDSLRMMREAA